METIKVRRPVCSSCGSSYVFADSFSSWDAEAGRWETEEAFEKGATCHGCDADMVSIEWRVTERPARCADIVADCWKSRREDFAGYMQHGDSEDAAESDGKLEGWAGLGAAQFFHDTGALNEYGLSFEYVNPAEECAEGFFRWRLMWGGPGEEIRFYAAPLSGRKGQSFPRGWTLYRAQFWRMDWGDGAAVDISHDEVALWLWWWMEDGEMPGFAFCDAEEDQ